MDDSGGFIGPPLLLTRIAAIVAVGVALGFLLAPVPNVELVTATCFCAGCLLGVGAGVLCSFLIECLFAGFHPMQSSMGLTLVAQCLGMAGAGLLGGLFRPLAGRLQSTMRAAAVTFLGLLSTLWFDLLTNLAFPVSAGFSFEQTFASLGLGLPFALIHLSSNMLVFLLVVSPAIPKLMRIAEQPL